MKLYHSSDVSVTIPDTIHSRDMRKLRFSTAYARKKCSTYV